MRYIWYDLSPRKIAKLSEEYRAQAISIDKFLNSIRNCDNLIVCRKQLFLYVYSYGNGKSDLTYQSSVSHIRKREINSTEQRLKGLKAVPVNTASYIVSTCK